MTRLSIVIPVLGNLNRLEDTLVSVLENRPEASEILVVLDEPYSDPYDLKGEVRFIEAPGSTNLARSINLALKATAGEKIHLLACGGEVSEGWTDRALERLDDCRVGCVAPLVVRADGSRRLLAAGVGYTSGGWIRPLASGQRVDCLVDSRTHPIAPHWTAAFYRRDAWDQVGPLAEELGGQASLVDLGLCLKRLGWTTLRERESIIHHDQTLRDGDFRRSLESQRLFWRWAGNGSWSWSLGCHALYLGAELLGGLLHPTRIPAHLAGRFLGTLAMGSHRRNHRRLVELEASMDPPIRPFAQADADEQLRKHCA